MKLTKNFFLSEFQCKDGTPVPVELIENVEQLAKQLQVIRDELGEGLHIVSGYRTKTWNKKVGGKVNSMHLQAKAADLITEKNSPKKLKALIERLIKEKKIINGGIGLYPSFVHYDVGPARRW